MNFNEEDKKKMKIAFSLIFISVIISVISVFLDNNSSNGEADKIAKELGKNYYKNDLYDNLSSNGTSLLSLLKSDGYKVDLQTLLDDNKDYVSYFVSENQTCDLENSYIVIYPKKPYKEGSYKIKTYLDCE
jgi:ubiquitin-protein ligase